MGGDFAVSSWTHQQLVGWCILPAAMVTHRNGLRMRPVRIDIRSFQLPWRRSVYGLSTQPLPLSRAVPTTGGGGADDGAGHISCMHVVICRRPLAAGGEGSDYGQVGVTSLQTDGRTDTKWGPTERATQGSGAGGLLLETDWSRRFPPPPPPIACCQLNPSKRASGLFCRPTRNRWPPRSWLARSLARWLGRPKTRLKRTRRAGSGDVGAMAKVTTLNKVNDRDWRVRMECTVQTNTKYPPYIRGYFVASFPMWAVLHRSVDLRIQTYTELVLLKYGKLATKYSRI